MKDKILSFLVLPSIMFALFLAFSPVGRVEAISGGVPAETCPATGDWVKVDDLSGLLYTYTALEGQLIAESCYKAGSHTPFFQTYDPALSSVTVTSTLLNPQGNAAQELSHASFRLVNEPDDDMCEWNLEIPADDDDCVPPEEEMCEWDETIPADDDDCVPPEEEMCEWNEEIPADDDDCLPPVVSCVETTDGDIVWGPWTVDPSDPTREYREGSYTKYDVNDPTKSCGTEEVDPERRDIPDDPDVLGEDDETGVVLAATGPTDNILVYVVELLLVAMLVTYSVFFTKTYLKNSK